MATFISQRLQGSSKIITVKPLQQGPVANEHKEIEHQAEMESGDEALLMASGQMASLKGGGSGLKMQSEFTGSLTMLITGNSFVTPRPV